MYLKGFILATLAVLQIITLFSFNQQTYADNVNNGVANGLNFEVNNEALLNKPDPDQIAAAMKQKPIIEEQERKAKERVDHINGLVKFLKAKHSPVANTEYATQLVDLSASNGADYRVVVAIMGVESGFCQAPYRINGNSYNCFGYLNGVKYDSYKSAFNDIVPKVARQYAARYGWNFESLAKAYGEIGWEKTSGDMRGYANSM